VFDSDKKDENVLNIADPNIWVNTPENRLKREKIRKDNFSFIFQNTNLMPNFNAIENVCITDMLNGHCFEEAYIKALIIFNTLKLGDLDWDIYPQNISGGQQQRVAFARALIPEYKVLFGDEPTGNLDRKTSYEVMGILNRYIKDSRLRARHSKNASNISESSTIIVSHDLDLATRFADRIIVLTKQEGKGTVLPVHVFMLNKETVPDNNSNTPDSRNKPDKQINNKYDFKSSIRQFFLEHPNVEDDLHELYINIRDKLKEQLRLEKGIYKPKANKNEPYRNYITINDYLTALYITINGHKGNLNTGGLFENDFIDHLQNKLHKSVKAYYDSEGNKQEFLGEGFASFLEQLLIPDDEPLHTKELKTVIDENDERWIVLGNGNKFGDNHLKQHIENLLDIDRSKNDLTRKPKTVLHQEDESHSAAGKPKSVKIQGKGGFDWVREKLLRDYIYDFFLWFNKVTPSRSSLHSGFTDLFYKKESKVLLDYNHRLKNFWTVFIIMLVTFIAIGFGNGSLIYLGKKMQDPFVNFINIAVPHDHQNDVATLIDLLNADTLARKEFGINKATGFTIFPLEFYNNKDGKYNLVDGRTINIEDPLLSVLLKPSNVVIGEPGGFRGFRDPGLIVSEKMLLDLGYPINTKYITVHIIEGESDYADIPVAVRAVLRRLPGDLESEISFLITDFLHANLVKPLTETGKPFNPSNTNSLVMHIDSRDTTEGNKVLESIRGYLNIMARKFTIDNSTFRIKEPKLLRLKVDTSFYEPTYNIEVSFMGRKPDHKMIARLYDTLVQNTELGKVSSTMLYNQNFYPLEQVLEADRRLDRLTVHLLKLDKIELFEKEYVKPKYPYIRLDMAKIESLKNYNYITKLTVGLSFILLILSVYSIASFLSNVFENHLNKIKMNIGTLMAFGTGGLKEIYRRLMMIYLIIPLFFSLVIASTLGYIGLVRWILKLFITNLDSGNFFSLWDWGLTSNTIPLLITLIAVSAIVFFTLQRYKTIITRILSKPPGPLINGRE